MLRSSRHFAASPTGRTQVAALFGQPQPQVRTRWSSDGHCAAGACPPALLAACARSNGQCGVPPSDAVSRKWCCPRFLAPPPVGAHRQRGFSTPICSACRTVYTSVLTFRRAALLLLLRRLPPPLSSRACGTAHVPAALLWLLPPRTKCMAIAGTWQLGGSPWQWLPLGWAAQHNPPSNSTATRQMQPGVAQQLLPAAAFPHSVPAIAARAARVRLLRERERAGGENPTLFVLSCCCCSQIFIGRSLHAGARGTYRCITRLFRGQIGRAELLRQVQCDRSHGCRCSAARLCNSHLLHLADDR